MTSPMSWLSTAETVDVGYESLVGLGIGSVGQYPEPLTGWSNDINPQVAPPGMISYTSHPWIAETRPIELPADTPRSVSYTSSSPIGNSSAIPRLSGDTIRPNSPGMDSFGNPYGIHYTSASSNVAYGNPSLMAAEHDPLWLPPLDDLPIGNIDAHNNTPVISNKAYANLRYQFEKLCLDTKRAYASCRSSDFPSIQHMNFFVRLYFHHFDPIMPIVHPEQLDFESFWPLALAMSAVGCQYSKVQGFSLCAGPLHEFLRRALAVELDSGKWAQHVIPLAQALVLSQIGILYGGSSQLPTLARAKHRTLAEIVEIFGLLRFEEHYTTGRSIDDQWKKWLTEETKRRLGFSIWLLDSMSTYHFGQRPLLCLDNVQCELPHASLWAAKTAVQWTERFDASKVNRTLHDAVGALYCNRDLPSDLGDFGNLILLHGIYEETFRAKGYCTRQMSPTASSSISMTKNRNEEQNSSTMPQRRSSLECVEAMNRAAVATVHEAGGVEHSTVFHLAVARVVLLAPYDSIQTLAKLTISQHPQHTNLRSDLISAEQVVIQWAQQDEQNARSAVLHCGLSFWHIRRHSRDAFYEPISVFLATLTMWAYSTYASRLPLLSQEKSVQHLDGMRSGSVTRQGSPDPRLSTSEHEPTFIRLDRPCDDELSQLFIRSGRPSAMRAHISGVGDIYSPQGPSNILREGRKILANVSSAWGRTQEYASILEALERSNIESTIPVA
ncbi:hypothetical protein SCAR479_11695 [Seiridium cardinale]|uniref:Xylanolytic transcriptional activator regulatory domain-containing protein n=1 Tax=Seiridium cardinale TaxID=138064 RepID=A0ABR2XD15_9PEZI